MKLIFISHLIILHNWLNNLGPLPAAETNPAYHPLTSVYFHVTTKEFCNLFINMEANFIFFCKIFLYLDEKGNLTPCGSAEADTVKEGFRQDLEERREDSHCVFSLVQSQISLKLNEELHFISNRDTVVNIHYKSRLLIYSSLMVVRVSILFKYK